MILGNFESSRSVHFVSRGSHALVADFLLDQAEEKLAVHDFLFQDAPDLAFRDSEDALAPGATAETLQELRRLGKFVALIVRPGPCPAKPRGDGP